MSLAEDLGRRRTLYKLAIARNDIRGARDIAVQAQKLVPEVNELWIPLQEALVIAYARPFTSNKPFGPIASSWGKFAAVDDQRRHDELIGMRNQLVAHSDAAQRAVVIFPPGTKPPFVSGTPSKRATLGVFHERPVPGYVDSVARLCEDLYARLHAAVETELQAMFGDIQTGPPFDLITGEIQEVGDGTVFGAGKAPPLSEP